MSSDQDSYLNKIRLIRQALIDAYGEPVWRDPMPPVAELVNTILSQNTNDLNRDAAYAALCQTYPNWEAVMNADTAELIDVIRIAGLANQKGPRLQNALKRIADQTGGEISLQFLKAMPLSEARNWLINIKGVGPKTAAIVLLFSLGLPAFPVDTHVYRVTGRIGIRPPDLNVEKAHIYLEEHIPEAYYYDLHLNLIRLGREVCGARNWHCYRCPVESLCAFDKKNLAPPEK